MFPEYHLYLVTLLLGVGFPVYFVVWLRRFSRAERGLGPRPSSLVFLAYLFSALAFIHFAATRGPFPKRARQYEVQQNVGHIYYPEVEYHTAHGAYPTGLHAFADMGYIPSRPPTNYALFCADDAIEPDPPSPFQPGTNWPLKLRPETTDTGFTCVAVGNIDWDGYPDVWTINDAKVLTNHPGDLWDPAPTDFTGPVRLYPDHPWLIRHDPNAFYFDSLSITVLIPAVLAALLAWEEWRRKVKGKRAKGRGKAL